MVIRILKRNTFIFLPLLIVFIITCGDEPSIPTSLNFEDFPAAPTNVKTSLGDGTIVLSWSHPKAEDVESYKIYRQDSTGQIFRNIGATELLTYSDTNLQNNREYRYKISAVGKNGLEGQKSDVVSGTPAIYGVTINSGVEYTTSPSVNLSFTAPINTSLVKVSNDSLFTNAQWESYVAVRNWTLSLEDGKKTVYVKFRDVEDRETVEPYTDSIILDTEAIIKQVTQDSDGRVLTNGDRIHFTVVTDEPKGKAWVNLELIQASINLFDDGSNGDSAPDDGIYEVDYEIPTGAEGEKASVFGNFIDRAGNVASILEASGDVTVRRSPNAVNLISVSPVVSSSTSLNLFWTENTDDDFANYRIFRTETPGVDTESPLVTIIQDQTTLSYADTTLVPNSTYYYRVYVFDLSGLFSGSNEESGTTGSN